MYVVMASPTVFPLSSTSHISHVGKSTESGVETIVTWETDDADNPYNWKQPKRSSPFSVGFCL